MTDRRQTLEDELARVVRMLGLKGADVLALEDGPFMRIRRVLVDAEAQLAHEVQVGERVARFSLEQVDGIEALVIGMTEVIRDRAEPMDEGAIAQVAATFTGLREGIEAGINLLREKEAASVG